MEIKKGIYAVYKGLEYKATIDASSKNVVLFSDDPASTNDGFVFFHGDYEKEIAPSEVESVYSCSPYTVYGGVYVFVEKIRNGKAELMYHGTKYSDEVRKLGFEQFDRYSYMKFVPMEELQEIIIEKKPLMGTKLSEDLA